MTPAQKAAREAEKQQQAMGAKPVSSDLTKFLIASNIVTLVLLVVTIFRKKDVR